jgi:hypothetical protein
VIDSLAVHEDANKEIESEHLRKLIEQAVELGEALTPDNRCPDRNRAAEMGPGGGAACA